MMDDERLYAITPDGWIFRATIFESKYVPRGYCRYQIELHVESVDWWYTVEQSFDAWLWTDAQTHCKERLDWWTANWRDTPVAQQVLDG